MSQARAGSTRVLVARPHGPHVDRATAGALREVRPLHGRCIITASECAGRRPRSAHRIGDTRSDCAGILGKTSQPMPIVRRCQPTVKGVSDPGCDANAPGNCRPRPTATARRPAKSHALDAADSIQQSRPRFLFQPARDRHECARSRARDCATDGDGPRMPAPLPDPGRFDGVAVGCRYAQRPGDRRQQGQVSLQAVVVSRWERSCGTA